MTETKKLSPKRRKSIGVTNQNKPVPLPARRRRAHSIVPGDRLSPLTKARRSLAPRKSILKASLMNLVDEPDQSSDTTTALLRKSLGRRVSFAEHAHVRLFKKRNEQISPSILSPESDSVARDPDHVSDENAYPGSEAVRARRSSGTSSWHAESMDLEGDNTAPNLSHFLRGSENTYDGEGGLDDDMEITEALSREILRKQSLSLSGKGPRRPLSEIPTPRPEAAAPAESSFTSSAEGNESQDSKAQSSSMSIISTDGEGESVTDNSVPIEYTIPTGRATAPATQDAAWLALKSVTHSGDQSLEEGGSSEQEPSFDLNEDAPLPPPRGGIDPELAEAQARLKAVRMSLGLDDDDEADFGGSIEGEGEPSFSGTDDSGDMNEGDRTINLTGYLSRAGSLGSAPMTETQMFGAEERPKDSPSTPSQSSPVQPPQAYQSQPVQFNVPRTIVSQVTTPPTPTPVPIASMPVSPFSFTFAPRLSSVSTPKSHGTLVNQSTTQSGDKDTSPSKSQPARSASSTKPRAASSIPRPTAAFAPPVARPSPKKRPAAQVEDENEAKPSPAKKPAIANRWNPAAAQSKESPAKQNEGAGSVVKRLSPSKRAPFMAAQAQVQRPEEAGDQEKNSLKIHLAKRKSLAFVPSNMAQRALKESPRKDKTLSRASVGREPSVLWSRAEKGDEKDKAGTCEREQTRQAVAVPSETRGSPKPSSPGVLKVQRMEPEPENKTVDLRLEATEQWREGIRDQSFADEEEVPISIADFFSMTDIRFMDEITAPRRSMHPSQHPPPRDASEIGLAEYVVANDLEWPQLELYSHVSEDLSGWIDKSKEEFRQAEEEAQKVTPELFIEFREADEVGKAELLHQLKLIKVKMQLCAKSEWYDWKLQWVEQLYERADEGFNGLEEDFKVLREITEIAEAKLPALEEEYAQVMRELEQEQADIAEIENCDQDYLAELKVSITEQDAAVAGLKADVSEAEAQLQYLEEQLADLEAQRAEHESGIKEAKRVMDVKKHTNKAEISKLKTNLEMLETLHQWRSTRVEPTLFEFVYQEYFRVSIPCVKYRPVADKIDIAIWGDTQLRFKDQWKQLSVYWLQVANQRIANSENTTSVPEIVQRLSSYWAACAQLRSQFRLVAVKYPTTMTMLDGGGFKATCKVMFANQKAKAFVSFIFDEETFASWPTSIRDIKTDVEIAYGAISRDLILEAVKMRLDQSTRTHNHACLLSACLEAQDIYP